MYIWLTGIILFVFCLVVLIMFTDTLRYVKIGYLVLRATPYEQSVSDQAPGILVVGDSTAYGTGAFDNTKTIAGRLGADFPTYNLTNRGVNGQTTAGLAAALEAIEVDQKFDLVLIQIGGNDILQKRPIADIETDLRRVFSEVQTRSDQIVMISSGNVGAAQAFVVNGQPDADYEALTRTARELFRQLAKEYNVYYVDLFKEPAEDVYLQNPTKYLAIDGLHPNETGYGYWYESLGPVVREILK